jgi:nucleoside-diphosphate-sugar epimerase
VASPRAENDGRSWLVTGGAGFLGSHLVDSLLADGGPVTVVDNLVTGRRGNLAQALARGGLDLREADLTGTSDLPRVTGIFHLASPASPPAYQSRPIDTLWTNAAGTRAVLEAARRFDARAVLASTSEVYGDPEVHPQTEEYWGHVNPIGERSCYDEGKRFAEALALAYTRTYGIDVRLARIFNTYGPRMDPHDGRVVSNFVGQALEGEALTVYGSGAQTRSFCYVSDLIRGLRGLMDMDGVPPGQPINLGNPTETTVAELARLVAELVGVPLHVRTTELPMDDPRRRCPDIARAVRYLGWRPSVPLRDGLRRTIEHFRALREAPIAA